MPHGGGGHAEVAVHGDQIVEVLQEGEAGLPVAEILRKHGISRNTYFTWKARYAGASVHELRRLRDLEAENARLKRMYADLALTGILGSLGGLGEIRFSCCGRPPERVVLVDYYHETNGATILEEVNRRLIETSKHSLVPGTLEADEEALECLGELGGSAGLHAPFLDGCVSNRSGIAICESGIICSSSPNCGSRSSPTRSAGFGSSRGCLGAVLCFG